jgi:hypothetical protein
MQISIEAVIAATKVLYADNISNHSGDNAPQIIDACEEVARKILEAAAPHMLSPMQSPMEDQDDLVEILKKERWKYSAMKDEDGRPEGGYFEQSNEDVAAATIKAGYQKLANPHRSQA